MTGVEKVKEFLDQAKTYYFLTTDGDQPKGRPFGFKIPADGKLYFLAQVHSKIVIVS